MDIDIFLHICRIGHMDLAYCHVIITYRHIAITHVYYLIV